MTLRVLAYNVRSLRDDADAVADVIRRARPDVVCLQEAPRFLRWRSRCAWLARRSGLLVVTGGRATGATLVLCRLGVDMRRTRNVVLSKTPGLHQRGLAMAGLALRGEQFVVASTHLGLREDERIRHAGEIVGLLRGAEAPVILAGDINEQPGSPAWTLLTRHWRDCGPSGAATFPASSPDRRIDTVFADPAYTVLSAEVLDGRDVASASDHRPVLVEFSFS